MDKEKDEELKSDGFEIFDGYNDEDLMSSEIVDIDDDSSNDNNIENTDITSDNYNNEISDDIYEDIDNDKSDIKDKEKDEEFNLKAEIWSWVKMLIIAALIAFVIDRFIIVNATVPTGSMENTIMTGSRMVGFRFSYLFDDPERGDIVIFKYPLDESQNYVKRIIGLPGETVKINNGQIYIYDSEGGLIEGPLQEDYLKEVWINGTGPYEFNIPEGKYLMLGDNRNYSSDARVWPSLKEYEEGDEYVSKDKILGKALFTYWPLSNIGILE